MESGTGSIRQSRGHVIGGINVNISKAILNKLETGHGLIDVICELVEGSDEIDYFDVADIVKENPTMMAVLVDEFKKRNMISPDAEEVNLTEIFKEL